MKFKAILLGLLMTLSLVPAQASAADWLVVHRSETASAKIVGISHSTKIWWQFKAPLGDPNKAHAKVDPSKWSVKFDKDGDHYSCDWAHQFKAVTYHLYMWQPITGQNWDASVTLPCSSSTERSSGIVSIAGAPMFPYVVQGVNTRWKVNIHEHWALRKDVFSVLKGTFAL